MIVTRPIFLPDPTGPLSVYSEARWARLEEKGHIFDWTISRGRETLSARGFDVPVPGDPAYQGVAV